MSTVLVVDDAAICREPMAEALRHHGFDALCAADGAEALERIRDRTPDLLLLDLLMPRLDGFSVLSAIRQNPSWKDIPVIVLTESAEKNDVVQAAHYGVQGYMLKSQFCLGKLLDRIRQCLKHEAPLPDTETRSTVVDPPKNLGAGMESSRAVSAECSPAVLTGHKRMDLRTDRPGPGPRGFARAAPGGLPAGSSLSDLSPVISREEALRLADEGLRLKPMGTTVQNVMAVTSQPWCSADDVAQAVASDQVLSIRVLKLANSSAYSRGRLVHSVKEAVQRIGVREVRQLVLTLGLVEQFEGTGFCGVEASLFWEHSTACGLAAAAIASVKSTRTHPARFDPHNSAAPLTRDGCGVGAVDEMFLLGMVHDVGRLILIDRLPEKYRMVLDAAEQHRLPLEVVEPRMLLLDHCEIGRRALERWKFAPEFIAAAESHHESPAKLERLAPEIRDPARAVALADSIAHALLLGSSGNDCLYPLDDLVAALSLTPAQLRTMATRVERETNELKLLIVSRGQEAMWKPFADKLRQLIGPFRPLCVDIEPDANTFRMACERLAAGGDPDALFAGEPTAGVECTAPGQSHASPGAEAPLAPTHSEPPNVAVLYLRAAQELAILSQELETKEEKTGCPPLPVIVICAKGDPDVGDSPIVARPHVVLRTPVRISTLLSAIQQLSA